MRKKYNKYKNKNELTKRDKRIVIYYTITNYQNGTYFQSF